MRQLRVDERMFLSGDNPSREAHPTPVGIDFAVSRIALANIHVDSVGRATRAADAESGAGSVKIGYRPYADNAEKCSIFLRCRVCNGLSSAC